MLMVGVDGFAENIEYVWGKFSAHQILPRQWQVAEGSHTGKHNGTRCVDVRLSNILDTGGKAFFKELWAAVCPPRLNYAYGFYRGRRRDLTMRILHTMRWKLRQTGLGHNTTFHDVANAFPATAHETLDVMVGECVPPQDHSLLACRCGHAHTHVIIHGHGDR